MPSRPKRDIVDSPTRMSSTTNDNMTSSLAKILFQVLVVVLLVANYWSIRESCTPSTFSTVTKDDLDTRSSADAAIDRPDDKRDGGLPVVMDFSGSSWCPKAICKSSPMCQPCKRRFLIIFSSGRSASTTLTWMMDSLPGVRMSGENNNLLRKQFSFYSGTFEAEHFEKGYGEKNAFGRNQILEGSLSCILQNAIELITPPEFPIQDQEEEQSTIVGFKTIRSHIAENNDNMQLFVDFLQEHLPCARYLVNYRSDIKAHIKSWGTNFNWTGDIAKEIQMENDNLMLLYSMLGPDQAYLLDSTKWTKNVTVLNEALGWLGYNSSCYFPEVLEFNTKQYMHTKTEFGDASIFSNCMRL